MDEEVLTAKFACDYEKCKGACCEITDGDAFDGCTVTDLESKEIYEKRFALRTYVKPSYRKILEEKPVYSDQDNLYVSCSKKGDCIFHGTRGCGLKRAKRDGIVKCGIPVHCELYPLLMEDGVLSVGHGYDDWHICDDAVEKGEREGVYAVEFCRAGIERMFGKAFYEELHSMLK